MTTLVPVAYDNGSSFQKDFLNVSLSNKYGALNLAYYFKIPSGLSTQYKNLPSSEWKNSDVYGLRRVFYIDKNIIAVEIIEFYPVCGKKYYNIYIGALLKNWNGWKILNT